MIFVGVDTGVSGAIGVIFPDKPPDVMEMPTLQVVVGQGSKKKIRRILNKQQILFLLEELMKQGSVAVGLEKPSAMPKKTVLPSGKEITESMGGVAMLSYGMGHGIWLGICTALRVPVDEIHPATWKSVMCAGMAKGKDASRIRVMQLFPTVDVSLKKHHGRADALLIAAFRQKLG